MSLLLWNEKQVAEAIGCSVHKLRADRFYNRGLPYVKNGKSVRYDPKVIEEYMQSKTIVPENAA